MKKTGKLIQTNDSKNNVAIKVENVSKSFKLPHNRQSSLKGVLVNLVGGGDRTYETQQVLKNVSFEIKKGEFFGIVGRNGSGKSTLLKMLAGIYTPSEGEISINGSLTPFIELGVGFNPELTGRENVYLNGALLGFDEKDVDAMYGDIVSFAELERFMDQKLKNYSSGMQVRLAFSIAIRSRSDILLFDEVLAVGDADFQKKCISTFRDLKKSGRTIVLVTHDMGQVERFCDRALVIAEGKILAVTTSEEASYIYSTLNIDKKLLEKNEANIINYPESRPGSGEVRVQSLSLYSGNKKTTIFKAEESLTISAILSKPISKGIPLSLGIAIHSDNGTVLVGPNTDSLRIPLNTHEITYTLDKIPFNNGDYSITVALYDADSREEYDVLYQAKQFIVTGAKGGGAINIIGDWNFTKQSRGNS